MAAVRARRAASSGRAAAAPVVRPRPEAADRRARVGAGRAARTASRPRRRRPAARPEPPGRRRGGAIRLPLRSLGRASRLRRASSRPPACFALAGCRRRRATAAPAPRRLLVALPALVADVGRPRVPCASLSPVHSNARSARATPNAWNIASLSSTSSDVSRLGTRNRCDSAMASARPASSPARSSSATRSAAHVRAAHALPSSPVARTSTGQRASNGSPASLPRSTRSPLACIAPEARGDDRLAAGADRCKPRGRQVVQPVGQRRARRRAARRRRSRRARRAPPRRATRPARTARRPLRRRARSRRACRRRRRFRWARRRPRHAGRAALGHLGPDARRGAVARVRGPVAQEHDTQVVSPVPSGHRRRRAHGAHEIARAVRIEPGEEGVHVVRAAAPVRATRPASRGTRGRTRAP